MERLAPPILDPILELFFFLFILTLYQHCATTAVLILAFGSGIVPFSLSRTLLFCSLRLLLSIFPVLFFLFVLPHRYC